MKILELQQGTEEWFAVRKEHFTASEAPAMMGESKYISRTQLLDHKKGWTTEVDEHTQKLFDKGHKAEQDALPFVEGLIGDELYPLVGVKEGTRLLASFDGITMMEDVVFEHKLFGKVLAENVANNVLEPHYYWQLEQQLLVSGAEKVIFVTSDGTQETARHMFYESVPERRAALIAGWEQFEKDLANHTPQAKTQSVVAEQTENLPTISYEMNGLSLTSNLSEFKAAADELVIKSKSELSTDQDFADAESRQKVFTQAEKDIKELQEKVLSEVVDISTFTKDLKYIGEQIRQARLAEFKQIKSRKEEIRLKIESEANKEITGFILPLMNELKVQFNADTSAIKEAMKGKKKLDNLKDAADTAVSQIKIAITEQANIVRANLNYAKSLGDYGFLFNDWSQIAFKDPADFEAVAKMRISDYKAKLEEEEEKKRIAEAEALAAEPEPAKEESEPVKEAAKQKQAPLTQEPIVNDNGESEEDCLTQAQIDALLDFNEVMKVSTSKSFSTALDNHIHSYIEANSRSVA